MTARESHIKGIRMLGGLTAGFAGIVFLFSLWNLDIRISEMFYSSSRGWFAAEKQPWKFLYHYGTIPGLVLTVLALGGWLFGYASPKIGRYKKYMLLVVLTSVIGGGIIINAVLKPYWGRPRPRETETFSGEWKYQHAFRPGTPGKGKSFTCGHCSMGFIFLTLFFFYKVKPRLAFAGGIFGAVYGSLTSMARIVQGAHFATDVFGSVYVLLLTACALYYFVLKIPVKPVDSVLDANKKRLLPVIILFSFLCVIITLFFLTRRPYYETWNYHFRPGKEVLQLEVVFNTKVSRKKVVYRNRKNVRLEVTAKGFGWINADPSFKIESEKFDDRLLIKGNVGRQGYFAELEHQILIEIPASRKNDLNVRVLHQNQL